MTTCEKCGRKLPALDIVTTLWPSAVSAPKKTELCDDCAATAWTVATKAVQAWIAEPKKEGK